MTATTRPSRRAVLRACLGAVGVVLLAGCGPFGSNFGSAGDDDSVSTSEQAAADLQDELAGMPGVTDPYVAYQDNATLQAHLEVSVEVADPSQLESTLPVIEQAAWLSHVDPLLSMTLTVVPPTGDGLTKEYDLDDGATVQELTAQWGDRP